jgi:hypothetical protein
MTDVERRPADQLGPPLQESGHATTLEESKEPPDGFVDEEDGDFASAFASDPSLLRPTFQGAQGEARPPRLSGEFSGHRLSYQDGLLFLLIPSFSAPFPNTPPLLSLRSKPLISSDPLPNETSASSSPSTTTVISPRSRSSTSSSPAFDPLNSGSSPSKTTGLSTAGRCLNPRA